MEPQARTDRTDNELIDAFLGGDDRAFSAIVERHRRRLTFVAQRYVSDHHDADDIVQEALFRAANSLGNYRQDAKLSTWLQRLVMNAGYDHAKYHRQRQMSSLDAFPLDPDYNTALSYEEHIDTSIALTEALNSLGEDQRATIYLTEIEGFSLADVAQAHGVQTGTVKSRRARAKEALRNALTSG
ncbi:sigma-70 family RNA polymerase sigma factor [Corynebacterium lizhenjunii]|uniref:Sigma-70 family RNA polymerase sigma factor n=1 Tax=Corynebacterium lizhenjunii TaxID=2709394 RepID=A0A7T0KEP4_9CORY|nr:sigma-70 family RNA polymerase sigma factor [Corynebacterium lizhenjunii]QPK79154.1 sigma-70 family RNA polymerase sigma factor [Corynebacterium lizhenjunii]